MDDWGYEGPEHSWRAGPLWLGFDTPLWWYSLRNWWLYSVLRRERPKYEPGFIPDIWDVDALDASAGLSISQMVDRAYEEQLSVGTTIHIPRVGNFGEKKDG